MSKAVGWEHHGPRASKVLRLRCVWSKCGTSSSETGFVWVGFPQGAVLLPCIRWANLFFHLFVLYAVAFIFRRFWTSMHNCPSNLYWFQGLLQEMAQNRPVMTSVDNFLSFLQWSIFVPFLFFFVPFVLFSIFDTVFSIFYVWSLFLPSFFSYSWFTCSKMLMPWPFTFKSGPVRKLVPGPSKNSLWRGVVSGRTS